jgi:hypothetical protein
MQMETTQIRCPNCNASHASAAASGQYTCEFCLQTFTTVDARREETRLLEEIKAWVQQRVGAAGGGGVDASSRAYIFQQKVFPELRRDVDRALERITGYSQFPLLTPPIPQSTASAGPNPLLASRERISPLKGLRVRCQSEDVGAFAVTDADRNSVSMLDRRLGEVLHLHNIASAAISGKPEGFAAARRNLEHLLQDTITEVTSSTKAEHRQFLSAITERYRMLVDVCRLFEEVVASSALVGETIAQRAEQLAKSLVEGAASLEAGTWSPAEAMPVVLAMREEGRGCQSLALWMRAYDIIGASRAASFFSFVAEVQGLFGTNASLEDVLEHCSFAVRAARGQIAAKVVDDFDWVSGWSEAQRARKTLGLFGTEEHLEGVEQFLLPVWLGEVSYSRSSGAVFKSGAEAKAWVIVDACAPSAAKVAVLGDDDATMRTVLGTPRPITGRELALPNSSPSAARNAFAQALRNRPDMLNAVVEVKGLAFLPAAVVHYSSKKGAREAASCLDNRVPIDGSARIQWQQAKTLLNRFA